MKLEELARQSSDAARASVAHLEAPVIGAEAHRTWVRPAVVGGALAALITVVAFAVVGVARGGDEGTTLASGAPVEVPRLGLAPLDAWQVSGAFDDSDSRGRPSPAFRYYGTAGDEAPFADGDLLVVTIELSEGDEIVTGDGDPIEVRGTTGELLDGEAQGLPAGTTMLSWQDTGPGSPGIGLASRSYTGEELVALAGQMVVDGAGPEAVRVPDDLGLQLLASQGSGPFAIPLGTAGESHVVFYERPTGDVSDSLSLSTSAGDLGEERITYLWWAGSVEAVDVAGRDGFTTEITGMSGKTLVWQPGDGLIASLTYSGEGAAPDLVALAATVVTIDDETWDEYRLADVDGSGATALTEVWGEDQGSIGGVAYTWRLGLQDDQFCFELDTDDGSMGSCQPLAQAPAPGESLALVIDNGTNESMTTAVIVADASVTAIDETSTSTALQRAEAAPGGGLDYWVFIGPAGAQADLRFSVIIDGEVVDTIAGNAVVVEEMPFESLGSGGADTAMPWEIGFIGSDLCIVGGAEQSTSCLPPADLGVYRPDQVDAVGQSFIVLSDVPPCLEAMGVSAVSTGAVTLVDGRQVWVVDGVVDGWQLLTRNQDAGTDVWIDLPDTEGTASWPTDVCS